MNIGNIDVVPAGTKNPYESGLMGGERSEALGRWLRGFEVVKMISKIDFLNMLKGINLASEMYSYQNHVGWFAKAGFLIAGPANTRDQAENNLRADLEKLILKEELAIAGPK